MALLIAPYFYIVDFIGLIGFLFNFITIGLRYLPTIPSL